VGGEIAVVVERIAACCVAVRGATVAVGPVPTCAVVGSRDLDFGLRRGACQLQPYSLVTCPGAYRYLGDGDASDLVA